MQYNSNPYQNGYSQPNYNNYNANNNSNGYNGYNGYNQNPYSPPQQQYYQQAQPTAVRVTPVPVTNQPRYCQSCGAKLSSSAKFCSICGNEIKKNS
jgi:hypothetical protein